MPTYAAIGIAAPLILVLLRVIQGLAVGGEWAGATLMAAEHVRRRNRGFAASIAVTGGPTGSVLATLMLGLFAGLPEDAFLAWGWRVPFLISAALVIIGLYMRYRVTESPDFLKAQAAGDGPHRASRSCVCCEKYPQSTLYGILAVAGPLFMQALLAILMVPLRRRHGRGDRQDALMMLTASASCTSSPSRSSPGSRTSFGRRPVMLAGAAVSVALVFPMFALFNSGSFWLIALGFMVGNPIIQASMYGPIGAFLAEKFDTRPATPASP